MCQTLLIWNFKRESKLLFVFIQTSHRGSNVSSCSVSRSSQAISWSPFILTSISAIRIYLVFCLSLSWDIEYNHKSFACGTLKFSGAGHKWSHVSKTNPRCNLADHNILRCPPPSNYIFFILWAHQVQQFSLLNQNVHFPIKNSLFFIYWLSLEQACSENHWFTTLSAGL